VGHYSRPDVFRLLFNARPNRTVVTEEALPEPSDLVPVEPAALQGV